MGVWNHLLVAPREPRLLPRDEFVGLLHDLIGNDIVQMPCAVMSGDYLSVSSSLSIRNKFIHHRYIDGKLITLPLDFPPGTHVPPESTCIIHYCGEDAEELLNSVGSAPYGTRDLCVWFEGLNFDNQEISYTGSYNGDVIVYAPTKPQELFYEVETRIEMTEAEIEIELEENPDYRMQSLESDTHVVQTCFRTIGSSGPYMTCPPMDAIFERYFGKDFIVDCSYS